MQSLKYIEICFAGYDSNETEGYFFAVDRTVTKEILRKLRRFVGYMYSYDMSVSNFLTQEPLLITHRKMEELLAVNQYVGYNRFNQTDEILSSENLREFFHFYRGKIGSEEVNDLWYNLGKVTFDLNELAGSDPDTEDEDSSDDDFTDSSFTVGSESSSDCYMFPPSTSPSSASTSASTSTAASSIWSISSSSSSSSFFDSGYDTVD